MLVGGSLLVALGLWLHDNAPALYVLLLVVVVFGTIAAWIISGNIAQEKVWEDWIESETSNLETKLRLMFAAPCVDCGRPQGEHFTRDGYPLVGCPASPE
jgi:hypothetical protein